MTSQRAAFKMADCVTMATLWQQQDGCYILHLQQYSHRLNLLFFFLRSYPLNRSQSTVCVATEILSGNVTKFGTGVPAFSSVGSLSPVFLRAVRCHDLLRHLSFCFVSFNTKEAARTVGRTVARCRLSSVVLKRVRNVGSVFSIRYWNDRSICFAPFYEGWNFNSGNYLFTTDTK